MPNKKIPLTKTERMRYRAKLKTNPGRRIKALEDDRLRKKRERLSMRCKRLNPKEAEKVWKKKREEIRAYKERETALERNSLK